MSFFSKVLGRNSSYLLAVAVTAFAVDRISEISANGIWASANRGVSRHQLTFWFIVNVYVIKLNRVYRRIIYFLLFFPDWTLEMIEMMAKLFPNWKQLTFEEIKGRFTEQEE